MAKEYPPTALETAECPPHYFKVGNNNVGTCAKCPEVRDFGRLLNRHYKEGYLRGRSRKGGRAKREGRE